MGDEDITVSEESIDYRLETSNNLLSLTCPFCGVPHEIKDIADLPQSTQKCTCCGKVLLQYTEDNDE